MRKSKKTVLIVTMDTNIFGTLKRGLKTGLYGVSFANGIKEVFKSITRKPGPDFILVDDDRSPLNCLDIVEEIRDINKDIPIIFVTAFSRKEMYEKAMEKGCNGFIAKPFTPDMLLDAISSLD